MRLLFIIDHFGSGGAQRQMILLALEMEKLGHKIEFFIYYPQYTHFLSLLRQSDIIINKVQKNKRFSIKVPLELGKLIRSGKFDAMISFLGTPNFEFRVTNSFACSIAISISKGTILKPQFFIKLYKSSRLDYFQCYFNLL